MKNLFIVLVIALSLFCPVIAQTTSTAPDKSAQLQEASRLSAQVTELYNNDRYDEAMPLAKRALEIRESVAGPNDPLVGDALQNLGLLYSGKRNYSDALSFYKRALAIFEKALGPDNAKSANTLHYLGWSYYAQSELSKAEETFQRSLAIREKVFGPDHLEVALALDILAQFYQQQLKYGKAVDYYKRELAVKEKVLGAAHKDVAEMAMRCACAMLQNMQPREFDEMRERADMILSNRMINPNAPTKVKGSVLQGKAIYRAEPEYPFAAKRGRIAGSVIIEVTVDEQGKVIEAKSLCGKNILADSALKAARDWKFTPTLINGMPVKVRGTITFNFNL